MYSLKRANWWKKFGSFLYDWYTKKKQKNKKIEEDSGWILLCFYFLYYIGKL